MEGGRWNGNKWEFFGPNGQPIKFNPSPRRRLGNSHQPARVFTGFHPRPSAPSRSPRRAGTPKRSPRRAGTPKRSPWSIMLRNGPRNIYKMIANKNLPNVVKEGLKEVLVARLLNGGTTSQIEKALANVSFKNNHRKELTEAMYETMNTRNLFELQGNPVVNAIIKKRALNAS